MIIYEQPLNEKIRLFLRLELLVRRFNYHVQQATQFDMLAALQRLLELYNLSARIDLKSDVIKEIDRISQSVRRAIEDPEQQQTLLNRLNAQVDHLYQLRGSLGQHLQTNQFFSQLRQRTSLPGGLNGFDIPILNYWLALDTSQQMADLQEWGEPFVVTAEAISALLEVMHAHCEGTEQVAQEGFFQLSLGTNKVYQLIQIELVDRRNVYPEISAGKQRFSLRFVECDQLAERGKQVQEDINFRLKLCAF